MAVAKALELLTTPRLLLGESFAARVVRDELTGEGNTVGSPISENAIILIALAVWYLDDGTKRGGYNVCRSAT